MTILVTIAGITNPTAQYMQQTTPVLYLVPQVGSLLHNVAWS